MQIEGIALLSGVAAPVESTALGTGYVIKERAASQVPTGSVSIIGSLRLPKDCPR